MSLTGAEHARKILDQGFTIVPASHSESDVEAFRRELLAVHRRSGSPVPYAPERRSLGPRVELSPTGFVVFQLLAEAPELAEILLSPVVVEVAREVLGADMHLELTGAVLSDETRPFFSWHNHIGGIDVEEYRARPAWPQFQTSQRLIAVVYLDDIDADRGELLALPRRVADPTAAPHNPFDEHWPGAVPLRFSRGSTLIFEQCTWHAVRQMQKAALRGFVGTYFTSQAAPRTRNVDESLHGFVGGGALLQSVLPRRPRQL